MNLSEDQKKLLESYPKYEILKKDFDLLPEYSTTNPTQSGNMGVKLWKRRTPLNAKNEDAIWFIGACEKDMINFYLPLFTDDEKTGHKGNDKRI